MQRLLWNHEFEDAFPSTLPRILDMVLLLGPMNGIWTCIEMAQLNRGEANTENYMVGTSQGTTTGIGDTVATCCIFSFLDIFTQQFIGLIVLYLDYLFWLEMLQKQISLGNKSWREWWLAV